MKPSKPIFVPKKEQKPDWVLESKKKDQHEAQLRKLEQVLKAQEQGNSLLKELAKGQGNKVDVAFSWPFDIPLMQKVEQILQIVKEIQERLAGGGGLTETQEQELAAKLSGPTGELQAAVEAQNQPNPTEVP